MPEPVRLQFTEQEAEDLKESLSIFLTWIDGFEAGLQHPIPGNKEPLRRLKTSLENRSLFEDDYPLGD